VGDSLENAMPGSEVAHGNGAGGVRMGRFGGQFFGGEGELEGGGMASEFDAMREREHKGDGEGNGWSPDGSPEGAAEGSMPNDFLS